MTPAQKQSLSREEVHAQLWKLAAKQFDKDPADLRPEHRIVEDLGADSLDVAELSMVVEDDLDVALPDELMGHANLTLADVERALWERLPGKK